MSSASTYWLARSGDEVAKAFLSRIQDFYARGSRNKDATFAFDMEKVQRLYYAYYGLNNYSSSSGLRSGGFDGELTTTYANNIRAIVKTILSMVAGDDIAFKVKANNNDAASIQQAMLANGILGGYVRRLRMSQVMYKAVEAALVTSEGWVVTTWDHYAGNIDYMSPDGQPIYEGDPLLEVYNGLNVIRDPEARDGKFGWVAVLDWKNKWDLAVTYPEKREQILNQRSNTDTVYMNFFGAGPLTFYRPVGTDPDRIPVFRAWAARSPALPDGLETIFLVDGTCLLKTPLPYEVIPAYRIVCSEIMGTGYGYSDIFDLMGISDFYNQSLNTILSNQAATGLQLIGIPKGSGLKRSDLSRGLGLVEFNPGLEPKAISLAATPPEVFTSLDMASRLMDQLVGLNPTSRGAVPDRMPASAIALQDGKSLKFQSPLQQAYVLACEAVAQAIVNMLRDFATTPRVRQFVGRFGQEYLKSFSADDIAGQGSVQVVMDNPANSTPAANAARADALLQNGLIKNKEEYFAIYATGRVDTVMEGPMSEVILIRSENEQLSMGIPQVVVATDNHIVHTQEHKVVLNSPEARQNQAVLKATLDHIQEHINQMEALSAQNPVAMQTVGINLGASQQQGAAVARGAPDDGKQAETANLNPGSGPPQGMEG